jgi:hypothetical protein
MNRQPARAALTQASGWRKSTYSIAQNDYVEITTEIRVRAEYAKPAIDLRWPGHGR